MLRIQATIGLNTYYFASEALDYDNRYWEPRISNAFQISRSFSVSDKSGNKIRTMDVQLDNRDGYFNSIEAADGLLNSKFTMYFNEGDNAVKKFTGKVTKINSYGEDISLNIREVGYEYLKEKFPDAQIAYDYYSTSGINDSWNAIPIHFGTVNRYPTPWVNLFYSDFIIGSGPIFKVSKIYFDKTVVFDIATGQNGYKPTPTSKTIKFRVYKGTGSTGSPEVVGGVESRYPGFAYIQLYDEATGDPIDPSTPDGEVSQIYVDLEGIVNAAGTAAERNPAQILYNLFTKPYTGYEGYGLGVSASDLDFSAAITECTIQGFKIDGSIDNTTEFGEWIDEILRCCRGQLREDAGVISIKIDSAPSAASVHFDETGEIGYDCNVATWNEPDRDSQTNRLKLSYSWNFETGKFNKKPDANEESPLGDTHLIDEAHALRLGGGIIPKYNTETLEYKLIKDDTTAHKLAQYYLKSITKQLKTTSLTTEVTIPNLDAGTVVKVTSPKFGWNQKQFRITNISRLEEYTELELQEYSADIFTFIDPGTGAETSGQLYSVYNIPAKPEMTSLVVTNEQLADGTTQTKVDVEFVAPTENAQFISLYYKLTSETEADFKPLAMELATTGTMSAIWKGIEVGNYNFRLVTISSVGIYSDLSVISGDKHYYGQPNAESYKTMTGDTVAPGKPTIPDYLLGQGVVTLSFDITGGVPSDFSHFAVSRKLDGGSLELIDAKYTGRLFTDTDVASYVARQYSIVAYDKTGNASETSDLTIALTPLKIATNDIQAGAITSETITSNAIYGKLFMTRCNVGCGVAGVIFDSAGIRAYSTTANTFNMDAATGNVSMTGTICALCGVIGGFTVSSTEGLYAGCTTTRVQMKPGAGFWAGATAIGDAPFSVTQAGVLKSTSGSIGGFSIGTNILCSTPAAGCSVGMSACNTSGAVAFWAGCSTVGSAPFRVTNLGALTAISGAIGGWTLAAASLSATNASIYSGAANVARVEMGTGACSAGINSANAGTDISFWAGSTFANRATAPFRITAAGVLTATNANITGAITATSGTFTGTVCACAGCIAGFSITNAAGIYSGSAATRIQMLAGTGLWLGADAFASAPFSVTNAGVLKAISGTIGGWTVGVTFLCANSCVGGSICLSNAIDNTSIQMFRCNTNSCFGTISLGNVLRLSTGWCCNAFHGMSIISNNSQQAFYAMTRLSDNVFFGQIAGWNFNSACLYSGNLILNSSGAISGAYTAGSAGWCINSAGSAEFNNVTVRGTVCASAGCIAGWVFDTGNIYKIYGDSRVQMSSAVGSVHRYVNSNANYGEFLGQIYNNGWTGRYGLAVTRGIGNYYFRADTDINGANQCSQIAGWNFNASQIYSTGCGLILCNTGAIQTGDFVTGNKGWKIDSVGNAEFNNICARGAIRTAVFIKDEISVVGGCTMIRPADIYDDATPLSATTSSHWLKNTDQFTVNDLIRIKDGVNDYWGHVTCKGVTGGKPFITVTFKSGVCNWTPTKGQAVVNYGSCLGCGGIMLNGQCPYIDLYTHCGLPWTGLESRVRIGNLAGWGTFDTLCPTYGIAAGCPTGQYMTYDSVSGVLDIAGNINVKSTLPLSMPAGAVGLWTAKGATTASVALSGGVKDVSGRAQHGTASSGVSVADSAIGKAFSFDGSSGKIAIGHTLIKDQSAITLAAWIKDPVGNYATIFGITFDLIFFTYGTGLAVQLVGSETFTASQSVTLNDGNWHLVAAVITANSIQLYSDGIALGSPASFGGLVWDYNTQSYIGASQNDPVPGRFLYQGLIANPQVYQRALTAAEIKTLYMLGNQQESGVITADRVQTGVLSSLNWAASTGSCISMNDGTFMFGGSSAPKLRWDGTTLCVNGCITSTAGSIGGWNIAAAALSTCAGAGIFCLVSSCASIYSYSCTYNSYAMHGKLFWSGAWKDAFGFSVTDGASGTLAAGMGYTTSSSVSLPSGTTMAAGCPFFYVGSGSTSYMQYYGGTLSVKGDVEVLSNGNILPDPDFRGVKYAASYLPGQASGTIVGEYFLSGSGTYNLATVHRTGTCAVYAKSNSNAMMIYAANSSSHAAVCSIDFIPVQCAATYTLSGYLAKEGANPSKAYLGLLYYDINRALICYDYPAAQAVATLTTTPTRYVGVKVMPANAAYVKIVAYNFQPALGTWLYISGLQLEIGSVATAWKNNQGGTITANNVISGTLKSLNWNGSTTGSCINLGNGTFNFGGDKLTFDGTTLTVKGTVCATSGKIGCFDISNGYLDFNSSRSLIASHYLCFGYVGCCSKVLLRYDSFCFEYNHDQTYNHLVFCKEIGVCFHGELFGTERTMAEVIVNPKNTGATTEEAILKISIGHTANPYAICTNGQIQASTFVGAANFSNLISSNTSNPYDANNTVTNGFYYANANVSLYGQTDGAIYNQANSANWQGQIYQDYRTGQLAVRGKCNGGWTTWLCIATNGCQIVGCTTYNYAVCGVAFCCGGVAGCAGIVYGVIGKASCIGVWGCVGYDMGVFGLACRCYGLMGCGLVGYGVYGYGGVYGVFGCSGGNYGVVGKASNYGVCGIALGSYPVAGNGAYYNTSTRTLKQNFEDIYVLPGLRTVCIQKWTWADANQRGFDEFVAPVAEEVQRAWGLTFKDDGYYTLDGIALKAAQEIDENVQVHESCITYLKDENNVLKSCIEQMSCKLKLIEERLGLN